MATLGLILLTLFVTLGACNEALKPPDAQNAQNAAVTKGIKSASPFGEKLTFELPDNEKSCFYEKFDKIVKYTFEYKVIRGGHYDVDVCIKSPNGKEVYKKTKQQSDVYEFETSLGIYEFCFSNEFSTITHKVVYFELHPSSVGSLASEAGQKPKATAHTQLEESMEALHQHNSKVVDYQTEYRLNEAQGRYVAEGLNIRVQWWSFCQALFILCAGMGQVFVLKTFFAERGPGSGGLSHPGNIKT